MVTLTHSYRPDGLRHRRSDSSGTTQVIWDGSDPLAQVDLSWNVQRFWSRGPHLVKGYSPGRVQRIGRSDAGAKMRPGEAGR